MIWTNEKKAAIITALGLLVESYLDEMKHEVKNQDEHDARLRADIEQAQALAGEVILKPTTEQL